MTPPSDVAGEELIRALRSIVTTHIKTHAHYALVRNAPRRTRDALIDALVADVCSLTNDFILKHQRGLAPGPSREAELVEDEDKD
jgi:hypothetical protein